MLARNRIRKGRELWLTITLGLLVGAHPGIGHAGDLRRDYARWVQRQEAVGGLRNLVLPLGWSKAYSQEFSPATGNATLDLVRSRIRVEIWNGASWLGDVWLVDNQPGPRRGASPDAGDAMIRLGALEDRGNAAVLEADFGRLPEDFEFDLVVVTRTGGTPVKAGVLFGAPGLWQRLHSDARGTLPPQQSGCDIDASGPEF